MKQHPLKYEQQATIPLSRGVFSQQQQQKAFEHTEGMLKGKTSHMCNYSASLYNCEHMFACEEKLPL